MRKLMVLEMVTLDGVMQAPGGREEDQRGGFTHGGWSAPYNDSVKMQIMGEGMSRGADLLFGRWTYEKMYNVWHGRTDNPFTAVFERSQKYVASRTLRGPLPWVNSTLLEGDAADAVARLKQEPGLDLLIMGSRLADAARAGGPVPAADPPARARIGTATLHRRRPVLRTQAREQRAHHHGRDHRDVRARRWRGADGSVILPTDTHAAERRQETRRMKLYLISLYQPGDGTPPPPEILEPVMREMYAIKRELEAAGSWVFAGGLHPPSTATVLKATADDVILTDGPFVEGKEHLGGFTILKAPDLDGALAWGLRYARAAPGLTIEVRPFQGEAED
jgi:dihydrofolate reductase